MSGKSSPEFQWTEDEIQLLLEATQNLKVEEDYKGLTWELTLGLTLTEWVVILHKQCKMNVQSF